MKPRKTLKNGSAELSSAPPRQEQDIIVPALIILAGLWFLASNAARPEPDNTRPDNAGDAAISQEIASNADSANNGIPWFAQALKTKKEVN